MDSLRSKWKSISIVGLLLILSALAFIVFSPYRSTAQVVTADGTVKSTYSAIRSKADVHSSLVRWLSSGTKLTITKEQFTTSDDTSLTKRWVYASNYNGYMREDLVGVSYRSVSADTSVSVHLRSGAGTGFSSLGVISKGTRIKVLLDAYSSNGQHWYRVQVNGRTGYMKASLVSVNSSTASTVPTSGNSASVIIPSASSSTSDSASVFSVKPLSTLRNVGSTGSILMNGTILRSSSSTLSAFLRSFNANTKLTISQEQFVTSNSTDSKDIWVYASNYGGYVRSDLVSGTDGNAAAVTKDFLNFRKGAGTSFASYLVIPKNSSLTVLCGAEAKDGTAWYRVKYNNQIGYVNAGYITFTNSSQPPTNNNSNDTSSSGSGSSSSARKAVTTDYLNFRSGAGTNCPVYFTLSKGLEVTITGNAVTVGNTDWLPLTINGKSGYVCSTYIKFEDQTKDNTNKSNTSNTSNAPNTSGNTSSNSSSSSGSADNTNSSGSSGNTSGNTGDTSSYISRAGFPDSYLSALAALHAKHPTWVFTPVNTGVSWSSAYAKMISNKNANLIYRTYAPAYKLTDKGSYNYLTDVYTGKDSAVFVSASDEAVGYFMDPRNFLNDTDIFMFSSSQFSEYQDVSMVQTILKSNPVLSTKENAQLFVDAGKYYNISAIYLATKALQEIGSNTSQVNGKYFGYFGYYNVFNIGANDSVFGGSLNAMQYAKKMGWTSLKKAIYGGASTLRTGFIANNQATAYTEHFNVLNGYSAIGTHVYMTAVYAPQAAAKTMASNYSSYGLLNKRLEFFIPVYNDMPASAYPKPSMSTNVDNNYYLKSLTVSYGDQTEKVISSDSLEYNTDFTVHIPADTSVVSIDAEKASKTSTASVSGSGTMQLTQQSQTFEITVKTGTGKSRAYHVTIVRDR